jgi:hypothetical protein
MVFVGLFLREHDLLEGFEEVGQLGLLGTS